MTAPEPKPDQLRSEAGPDPESPQAAEPQKRRYTRSERQREASRRNIRLAQQAARGRVKRPGYQSSPQRQAASCASLKLANEVRLRDPSCSYTPCFRDGLSVVDLERSLGMAGEKLEDYRAHMQWFERVFTAGSEELPGAAGIHKLATALGQATWRRLRVFRTLPDWERLAVCHSLGRLSLRRQQGAELTAADLVEWAQELEIFALADARLDGWDKAATLDNRIAALASQLLCERGEEGLERGRPSHVVSNYDFYTAEALGNPLRPTGQRSGAWDQGPGQQEPGAGDPDFLTSDPYLLVPDPSLLIPEPACSSSRAPSVSSSPFAPYMGVPWLRHRLLPQERKREAEGQPSVPRCFEDFLKLMEKALGAVAAVGDRREGSGTGAAAAVSDHGPSAPTERRYNDPELKELADALWARLEFFRTLGEREAAELQVLQKNYPASLGDADAAEPGACRPLRPLALRLVRGFRQGEQMFQLLAGYEQRVKQAVYALVEKRCGDQPEVRELKPRSLDNSNMLVRAMLLNSMGLKVEAEKLFNLANEIEAAARGQPPPAPSELYCVWRPGAWD